MDKYHAAGAVPAERITSCDDPGLRAALHDPAFVASRRVGVEIEFVAFEQASGKSPGQAGSANGPGAMLEWLAQEIGPEARLLREPQTGWPAILELTNGGRFSLENGGQLEYASTPQPGLDAVADELTAALRWCEGAAAGRLAFLSHGTHPTLEARLDPVVPNARFLVMERYFAPESIHRWGNYTCALQVNLDVPPDVDWQAATVMGFELSRFTHAMFANSAFLHGERATGPSARLALSALVDPKRRAVPAAVIAAPDLATAFKDWALDVDVLFVGDLPVDALPRRGELTFRRWIEEGFRGTWPDLKAWTRHLGTLWPDVRPRRFIELRAADAQPFEHVMAVVAFWRALIQVPAGLAAARAYMDGPGALADVADPAAHDALLALAAEALRGTEEAGWAAAIEAYRAFRVERERGWEGLGAEAFVAAATTTTPAAALRRVR
ncbi:MAG: hypothetical protein JWM80_1028 [Cyanobacteria bacterium RYN_339]|nr:hypothetical protein [Cyanobacteria bacterium RYN_339]